MAQAVAENHLVTADELLHMPERGVRYELIRGELREMTPPGQEHAEIADDLHWHLSSHVRPNRLGRVFGELGFRIGSNPDTVRVPDLAFVRGERLAPGHGNKGYLDGAPDLAVEVRSPNDTFAAVDRKAREWIAAGCRMVIVVNPPRRTVHVYLPNADPEVLTTARVLDGGEVVPGWKLPIREIFSES